MKSVIDFIKTLLNYEDTELTVLLYDDRTSEDTSSSFLIRPTHLARLIYGASGILIVVTTALIAFTPIKRLVVPSASPEVREELIDVSKRVSALQDTLQMRDRQLREMKSVILDGSDTTFSVAQQPASQVSDANTGSETISLQPFYTPVKPEELIGQQALVQSKLVTESIDFPVNFPVEGTFTRGIKREKGHYGIDIATATGALVSAIADGTVISSSWTPNYGYVLRIQHGAGYMSVYKHCQSLWYEEGDLVQEGDILGEVGDVGILSSGPHLHFELWRRGTPLNPESFLTQN